MVAESNQNVFMIKIDALSFAEFEISEFEISRFDCTHLIQSPETMVTMKNAVCLALGLMQMGFNP